MNMLDLQGESMGCHTEIAMAAIMAKAEGMELKDTKELQGRADKTQWEEAMRDEIKRLDSRKMWKVVKKPKDTNIIGSKWVFRLKKNANGEIQTYRAHLVTQGYT
jgi:Reverse transcriptase (RNA-dependent DNA polymerase)